MKKLLLAVFVVGGVWFLWPHGTAPAPSDARGKNLLFDRAWIDHLPRNERDPVQWLVAVTDEPHGVFIAQTQWKGSWEAFRYEPRGDGKLELLFPQSGSKETATYKATSCQDKGFDYCLEIAGPTRGVKRYFSRKGWEVSGGGSVEQLAGKLAHLGADRALETHEADSDSDAK